MSTIPPPMSPAAPTGLAYVGMVSRIDLLPTEVRERAATRTTRSVMLLLVLLAVVVVAGGFALAFLRSLDAQSALAAAQAQTSALQAQQQQFAGLRGLQQRVALGDAAEQVATATAVDWEQIVGELTSGLPAGAELGAITAEAQSPIQTEAAPGVPLQQPRIGSVKLTATDKHLAALTKWVAALQQDQTFSDVVATTVTGPKGGYVVTLTAYLSPSLTPVPTATTAPTSAPTPAPTPAPTSTGVNG